MHDLLIAPEQAGLTAGQSHAAHVAAIEEILIKSPPVDCQIRHFFAPGIFLREINIPAGVTLVGSTHTTDSLIIVSKGRILIATESGPIEIVAGDTLTCHAGSKNLGSAIEDTRWTNVFPNPENETNVEILLERFCTSKASELFGGVDNRQFIAHCTTPQLES